MASCTIPKENVSKLIFTLITGMVVFACNQNSSKEGLIADKPDNGTIYISVDESFKPVITEEIKVYESTYPNAHIIASYKAEADCFRDLQKDSTRMIIVAKGLTKDESAVYESRLSYKPEWDILAYDAVDVIVNPASKDSIFTLQRLQDLLSGKDTGKIMVVDGKNATSTARYLLDSVLNGKPFGKNVMAAQGSKAVIDYVIRNTDAVGFVGSSWVGNDDDPEQLAYANKITMAVLECKYCKKGIFAKPSQATITYNQYPLVRPLYYILKENTTGLGRAFKNFMTLERGQLIFRRSYLVPGKMNFNVRSSNIK